MNGGAVCKAVSKRLSIPAIVGISESNPAVEIYRNYAWMVPSGNSALKLKSAAEAMVQLAFCLAEGKPPAKGSYLPSGVRELIVMPNSGAARAADMLATKLSSQEVETELPLPTFEKVDPAPPLKDLSQSTIILATEGGLVPRGIPTISKFPWPHDMVVIRLRECPPSIPKASPWVTVVTITARLKPILTGCYLWT